MAEVRQRVKNPNLVKHMLASQFVFVALALLLLVACAQPETTPTPTPTATPTPEPVPTPTSSLTPTLPPGVTVPELVKVADLPGGDIVAINFAPSSPSVVYLASETNAMGIWRSDDVGETWRQVLADYGTGGPAHIHKIAVHPTDPNIVLIADAHSLSKMEIKGGDVQWKIVYPPTSGIKAESPLSVSTVAFSPSMPSLAYAAGEDGTILKSTDTGDTWQTVGRLESQVPSLTVDLRRPDMLFAGTWNGVLKSTDGGQSFKKVLPGGASAVAIDSGDPDLILAAGGAGVFKSSDAGATWRRIFDRQAHSVQVAPSDSRVVYVGTPEGVFKSSDGGDTWRSHSTGIELLNVGSVAVHPGNPNIVVAGSDVGLWTPYAQWGEKGRLHPSSTQGEGIYKTTDGGLSWVKKGEEFIDVDVIEVAVDPDNPDLVYVGDRCSRGLFQSEDGGASWTFLAGDVYVPHYTMRILLGANSTIWLTGANGMGWSADGKGEWMFPFPEERPRHFHGLGISPHDPKLMFVGTVGGDPPPATKYPGAWILRTEDGGLSWREVGEGFPSGADTAIEDFAFDPFNPNVVYVSTSSHHRLAGMPKTTLGTYKSTDRGKTWFPVNNGLVSRVMEKGKIQETTMNVHSIVASPAQAGLLYAGTTSGVFRSINGGDSWTYIGPHEHMHVERLLIDPAKPNSLYAGTDEGLFWSPDGGNTWLRLESVPAKPVTGLAMDAQGRVLYAAVNTVGVLKGVK